jgi:hypothetical protein
MTVTADLARSELTVAAGEETTTGLRVANRGDVVDQLTVEVLGDAAGWCTATPDAVNLMPGTDAEVTLTFSPPRSAGVPAGQVPFGVRVRSREYPDSSTVAEGEVAVGGFTDMLAELVPPRRRARRRARYRLAVENAGNRPEAVELAAFDTEGDELDLRLNPSDVIARPGTVTIVRVSAKPRRRMLRGEPRQHPFQLEMNSVDDHLSEPVVVNGVMVQERLLPKWLLPAAIAAAAGVVALAAFWFAVLKPTVQSVAAEEVAPQVQQASAAAEEAKDAAEVATGGGENGSDSGGGSGSGADGSAGGDDAVAPSQSPSRTAPATPARPATEPVDFRIATSAPAVTDTSYQRFTFTAPDRRAMAIGDLVLQNPRGDNGFLRIRLGDDIVLETGLANFRDLDYHYVNPLHVKGATPVVVEVNCVAPGSGAPRCTPSVSFSGNLLR